MNTTTPRTFTGAPASATHATYHDAVLHAHLLAVTRADAISLSIRRGAATVTTQDDAIALFADVSERQARRLASHYPMVSYAMAKLPPGYWRWNR